MNNPNPNSVQMSEMEMAQENSNMLNVLSKREDAVMLKLADIELGEVQGVRKDSPANQPLSATEQGLYYFFNVLGAIIGLPCQLLCCFGAFVIQPMQARIIMVYGKVVKTLDTPGLHWVPPILVEQERVDLRLQTLKLPTSVIPDSTGSPMNVRTLITYVVSNPVAATYNVENMYQFMQNQALEVVKTICGRFKYRDQDQNMPSLLQDSAIVMREMKNLLQQRCDIAGVEIMGFTFLDIAYQPHIAAGLLQVQQAQARVDARKLIVKGAVLITHEAIEKLNASPGIELTKEDTAQLVKSLMCLTCSDSGECKAVLNIA